MTRKKVYERAIRNWPEEDRPREKLLRYGAHTLSNAELLAILTRNLVIAGRAMEIRVFDHLIIGDGCYFSFADEGLIEEYEMRSIL